MADVPDLLIATEKVCFIIAMARQFDEKEGETDPDEGSNPSDDDQRDVLEDNSDDAVELELKSFIHDLDVDEKVDLISLVWLGRGDGGIDEWETLRANARDTPEKRVASYLMGMPQLSDYLEEGLSLFGLSCEDEE